MLQDCFLFFCFFPEEKEEIKNYRMCISRGIVQLTVIYEMCTFSVSMFAAIEDWFYVENL